METVWDIVVDVILPGQDKLVNGGHPSALTATSTRMTNTKGLWMLRTGVEIRVEKPRMDHGATQQTHRKDGITAMFLNAIIQVGNATECWLI